VLKETYPRRLRAVRIANAVNKVEGVPVTETAQQLSAQWVRGEITGEAMRAALLAKHRKHTHESTRRKITNQYRMSTARMVTMWVNGSAPI